MEPPAPTPSAADLPRTTFYQVVHELTRSLPLPHIDTPEAYAQRDAAAIAHVACLLPANPEEAHIAVLYVAAGAQALDSLRLSRAFPNDETLYVKCTAQSASMMRQSRSWRTLLLRVQAERKTREADATAQTTEAQAHQAALGQLSEALAETPPPSPPTQPKQPSPIVEAERYAVLHRKRATLIRSLGRLPDRLSVGYLPPAVVHALVTGTTPILRALGKKSPTPANLAA